MANMQNVITRFFLIRTPLTSRHFKKAPPKALCKQPTGVPYSCVRSILYKSCQGVVDKVCLQNNFTTQRFVLSWSGIWLLFLFSRNVCFNPNHYCWLDLIDGFYFSCNIFCFLNHIFLALKVDRTHQDWWKFQYSQRCLEREDVSLLKDFPPSSFLGCIQLFWTKGDPSHILRVKHWCRKLTQFQFNRHNCVQSLLHNYNTLISM